jgi:hypothetical protein
LGLSVYLPKHSKAGLEKNPRNNEEEELFKKVK